MDEDLDALTREQLVEEVRRLRAGIRAHRDSSGHDLCWHHPALWSLLPEPLDRRLAVPEWPQFLKGCIRYRQALDEQLPDAPRTTGEAGEQRPMADRRAPRPRGRRPPAGRKPAPRARRRRVRRRSARSADTRR